MIPPTTATDVSAGLGGARFSGELISLPAPGKGHDASLLGEDFVGVADGSTPLVETVAIDAHGYAQAALERLRRHRSLPPEEMFRRALSIPDPDLGPVSHRPSSTVITITVREGELLASVLGDCLGVIRHRNGNCGVAWDRQIEGFDRPVAERMAREVSTGTSVEEARETAGPRLLENRRQANREGTYWLFADDPAAAAHVSVTPARLDDVEEVLLCSDGFTRLIDPFEIASDPADLLRQAGDQGLAALGSELRAAEKKPDSFTRFPRLDVSDDATAILLRRS